MLIVKIMIAIGIGNDIALLPQQYPTNIGVIMHKKRHKIGVNWRKIDARS